METSNRNQWLRMALLLVGATFTFGILPLSIFWPSGWSWHPHGRNEYFEMILGVYAVLGIFLMRAARDPVAHASLIWFTVWSSVAHAGVMALQALSKAELHLGHLWGDVPALLAVAAVLAWLLPRRPSVRV